MATQQKHRKTQTKIFFFFLIFSKTCLLYICLICHRNTCYLNIFSKTSLLVFTASPGIFLFTSSISRHSPASISSSFSVKRRENTNTKKNIFTFLSIYTQTKMKQDNKMLSLEQFPFTLAVLKFELKKKKMSKKYENKHNPPQ